MGDNGVLSADKASVGVLIVFSEFSEDLCVVGRSDAKIITVCCNPKTVCCIVLINMMLYLGDYYTSIRYY